MTAHKRFSPLKSHGDRPIPALPQSTTRLACRVSQVRAELTRLFDEQVEFFRRRAQQQPNPADLREYQERRERIRQLFAELRGLR